MTSMWNDRPFGGFFDDDDFFMFDRMDRDMNRAMRNTMRMLENSPMMGTGGSNMGGNMGNEMALTNMPGGGYGNQLMGPMGSMGSLMNPTKGMLSLMSTDLIESENDYQVMCDLPGVNPENIDVSIQDNNLCIKAERKYVHEVNNDKVHSMERSYGKVSRKIRLPKNCDMDHCQSKMVNGVLTITFPKKMMTKSNFKKLPIRLENADKTK